MTGDYLRSLYHFGTTLPICFTIGAGLTAPLNMAYSRCHAYVKGTLFEDNEHHLQRRLRHASEHANSVRAMPCMYAFDVADVIKDTCRVWSAVAKGTCRVWSAVAKGTCRVWSAIADCQGHMSGSECGCQEHMPYKVARNKKHG
jgi:hypothetical protein